MVCSLTKTAAAEIAGRDLPIPKKCVGTLHAHAFAALGHPTVAEASIPDWNKIHPAYALLCDTGAAGDAEEPDWDKRLARSSSGGDMMSQEYHCLRAKMTPRHEWPVSIQAFAKKWEDWKADAGVIDFSDMISICHDDHVPAQIEPSVVIADEAQDHSRLEYALLGRWGKDAGALIMAGDPWQALFCWRGSDPEIFDDPEVAEDHRRILQKSFRIPSRVHKAANWWIREHLSTWRPIKYEPRDCEGVASTCEATWKQPEAAIKLATRLMDKGQSVMFAFSCGYFTRPLIAQLRGKGIPFSNPWRTQRGDWNPLQARRGVTMADRVYSYLQPATDGNALGWWTAPELQHWAEVIASKGTLHHGAKARISDFVNQAEDNGVEFVSAEQLADFLEPDALKELLRAMTVAQETDHGVGPALDWLQSRLTASRRQAAKFPISIARKYGAPCLKSEPKCFVGTIHSFKGGEADAVLLFPDLSPSGYTEWFSGGTVRDSVTRMFYVGMTRAKTALYICKAAGKFDVPLEESIRSANDDSKKTA
jgi:hypothetical protein